MPGDAPGGRTIGLHQYGGYSVPDAEAEGYLESPRSGFYVRQTFVGRFCRPEPAQPALAAWRRRCSWICPPGVVPGCSRHGPGRGWKKELLYSSPQLLSPGMPEGAGAAAGAGRVSGPVPGACGAAPIRSWWGQGWSICWGCWPRCCPARRQWKHPATRGPSRCWKTTGCPATAWVDREGMSVQALDYFGAVLSDRPANIPRRSPSSRPRAATGLLHWAARGQGRRLIIEDDYDSEFRFDTRPLPHLPGMAGRWAGGVSVHLFPESCPRHPHCVYGPAGASAAAWQRAYALYAGTVGRFEQQTLARFITGGYFARHLARERVACEKKDPSGMVWCRGWTGRSARGDRPGRAAYRAASAAAPADPAPDHILRRMAARQGVRVALLSDYCLDGSTQGCKGTLVLGYGSLSDAVVRRPGLG